MSTHVPAVIDNIKRNLVSLKMPRALEILDITVRGIERGEMTALEAIDVLLTEELTLRENRRIKMALLMARLSAIKTLAGFDFSFQPSLDKNRIMALAELQFIDRSEVIHLIGPPGTGKSHLSLALGVEAVKAGRSVYFATLADIVGALAKAEREGGLREKIRFFCRFAILIVDEIGYLPVTAGGGNLFFQLVNARYEKGAMILTSNRGFAEWGEIFGDPVVATALLDRLLHHAIVIQIEGSSYRLRHRAVEKLADVSLLGQRADIPGVPVSLLFAPLSSHLVLADRPAEQRCERPAHAARVGAGEVCARNQRVGCQRAPLIGPQRLALPFARPALGSVQPGARHRDLDRPEGAGQ